VVGGPNLVRRGHRHCWINSYGHRRCNW
jgi:hypothetical protein